MAYDDPDDSCPCEKVCRCDEVRLLKNENKRLARELEDRKDGCEDQRTVVMSATKSGKATAFWKPRALNAEKAILGQMETIKGLRDEVRKVKAERDVLARQNREMSCKKKS